MTTTQTVLLIDGQSTCDHDGMSQTAGFACPACSRVVTEAGREIVTGDYNCGHVELAPAVLHECTKPVAFEPAPTEDDPEPVTKYAPCGRLTWDVEVPE
jgi:hypothetical protein